MQTNEMIRLYEKGWSTGDIAKIAGYKTPKSIGDKLKAAGITLRTSKETKIGKKDYPENLFEIIDSEWKAYFLGLLLTDGWVTNDRTVGYSSIDLDAAEFISNCTGKSIQTVQRPTTCIGPTGNTINQSTEYRICLSSTKIVDDLKRLSVVHNKTHILSGPTLTSEEMRFLKYIVQGIIDGDGTLGFPSNKPSSMYFRIVSASEKFIDWCIWALEILGMKDIRKRFTGLLWECNSAKPDNLLALRNIYEPNLGMQRKGILISNHFKNHTVAALSSN
jgi:hypothetical protein